MAPEKGGRVVFIGNIPYGVSEEQIVDIFSRIGQVNNFRLVHDKETGRPKGFGFLEFADPDAAASAVRNLNDHEVMNRKLRVDWSNDNSGGGGGSGGDNASSGANGADNSQGPQSSTIPTLPAGTDPSAGLTVPDAISKTLSQTPTPQLLDLISQVKNLVTDNPGQALTLFQQAPQFTYATFQALLLLGLVDTATLTNVLSGAAGQPQVQAAPPPTAQPPQAAYPVPAGYPGYPPQFQPPAAIPTPPVQQSAYQPPPPQAPPAAAPAANTNDLIRQVLSMTAEQINALPDPMAIAQIKQLRAQLGAPVP
ncbi:hypothetical protein M8818_004522 [Zalaria obscura]|uniref:Uncharacterized protein n=1 Tax=Zalaria obscura TaxID=2024903 RepID=A0ACC3SD65_9PEZI